MLHWAQSYRLCSSYRLRPVLTKIRPLVLKLSQVSLFKEAGFMFAIRAASYFIAFVVNIAYARMLGVDAFTTYIYALSWLPILQTLSLIGFDSTVLKFFPRYDFEKAWGKLISLTRYSIWLMLALSIAIAAVFKSGTLIFPISTEPAMGSAITALAFCVPALVVFSMQFTLLRVMNKVLLGTVLQDILRPLLQVAVVYAVVLIMQEPTASAALYTYLFTMGLIIVVAQWHINKEFPQEAKKAKPTHEWKLWIAVALPLFANNSFQLINSSMDIIMLGYLRGTKEAGFYGVAARIAALGSFGLAAINLIIVPSLSRLHAANDHAGLQAKVRQASWLILLSGLAFAILIFLTSGLLLALFGPEYIHARSTLLILLIGHLYISLAGTAGYVMAMTGHHNQVFKITMISAFQNVILNYFFITHWGSHGAAAATVYTHIFSTSLMVIYLMRNSNVNTTLFPLHKLVRPKS